MNTFIKSMKAIIVAGLIAGGALQAEAVTAPPKYNFELYNLLDNSVYITLDKVTTGFKGSNTWATEVESGKGNQFKTNVIRNLPTTIKFWQNAGQTGSGNRLIGEYQIAGVIQYEGEAFNPPTIYLTISKKGDKILLMRQLDTQRTGKTESGLSLSNNVPASDIKTRKPYIPVRSKPS